MKKTTALLVLQVCFQLSFGQTGFISFNAPKTNQLEDSILSIDLVVAGFPDTAVTATVSGRQVLLTTIAGRSIGTLSLSGLPQGPLTLQVTATDAGNNQLTASQPFIYIIPPLLLIDSPLSWSAATPQVHIKARCVDSTGCTINVSENFNPAAFTPVNFNFGSSVDTVLDLSAYNGTSGSIGFTSTNTIGQQTVSSRQVLVDASPYLKPVFAANDEIFDFNYNKVLVTNPLPYANDIHIPDANPFVYRSRIVDINTGDSVPIPYPGLLNPYNYPGQASLTPYGAIFESFDTLTSLSSIYDWNADSLYMLAQNTGLSLQVAGNYATWLNGSSLYIRNLQTATTALVSTTVDQNAVAPNGLVAYGGNDYNIYRFAGGSSAVITSTDGTTWNTNPATDGYKIVYSKTAPCCAPCCTIPAFALHVYNGLSDSVLSQIGTLESTRIVTWQLNNHFIAYPKQDTGGTLQIWRKDSLGNDGQVTFFNNDSKIDLLNPNGDLTLIRKSTAPVSRRYFADKVTGQVTDICSSLGQTLYRDSTWYLALGRMLYKIDLKSIPNAVTNSNISIDSPVYPLKPSDFIQNYSGFAALASVTITTLPKIGVLLLNGTPMNAGTPIAKASLGQLTYHPDQDQAEEDSLVWTGSNGSASTSPATITFTITPWKPYAPSISGLLPAYCNSQGEQKIRILNLPDTSTHFSVTVTLDDNDLTIADSSFPLSPDNMTPGGHAVVITYGNAAGTASLTDSFTITAGVTPQVNLSTSVSTVNGLSAPVIITATNTGGGGSNPLYTFARDRSMTDILQEEGSGNRITINPSTLAPGSYWIYGRMRTSDTCYTVQTNTDSVLLTRNATTGILDPDYPGQEIGIYPNPFSQFITIEGLQPAKDYLLVIHGSVGERSYQLPVTNSTSASLDASALPAGGYWLSVYDTKKNALIGTMPVFKK